MKGMPFFVPWQPMEIPYDSLLGVSLTLNRTEITEVYLEKYQKDDKHIKLIITYKATGSNNHKILTHIDQDIDDGVNIIYFEGTDVLSSGSITIVNSTMPEVSTMPVQISPLYIKYIDVDDNISNVSINNQSIKSSDLNIMFDALATDIYYIEKEQGTTAYITFNKSFNTQIDNRQEYGITNFGGIDVSFNPSSNAYEGVLQLPEDFKVYKRNSSFALIAPYTYETCPTSIYPLSNLGEIDCNVSKNETFTLPLDDCFTDTLELDPYRIDTLQAPDGVPYWNLNDRH